MPFSFSSLFFRKAKCKNRGRLAAEAVGDCPTREAHPRALPASKCRDAVGRGSRVAPFSPFLSNHPSVGGGGAPLSSTAAQQLHTRHRIMAELPAERRGEREGRASPSRTHTLRRSHQTGSPKTEGARPENWRLHLWLMSAILFRLFFLFIYLFPFPPRTGRSSRRCSLTGGVTRARTCKWV